MAKTPKKQLEYASNYLKKFDEIKVRVPKGEKEEFQELARRKGKSLNALIYDLLKETMERDQGE